MSIKSGVFEWKEYTSIKGEKRMRTTTPKRKTSIYVDEQNIPKIQELQRKYNLSLNRVVNMCLNKYLPEMRVWI